MRDRRRVWMDFMARFHPLNRQGAMARGHYVERPWRSVSALFPVGFTSVSTVIVSGTTGSGKTTELLATRDHLALCGVLAVLVDASDHSCASHLGSTSLFRYVMGHTSAMRIRRSSNTHPVVALLDGLDAEDAVDVADFQHAALNLAQHHVPLVVAVGVGKNDASRALSEIREVSPRLRHVRLDPLASGVETAIASAFLVEVLRTRDEEDRLTAPAVERLVDIADGSILKLLNWTVACGSEAYQRGFDVVDVDLVEAVWGRAHPLQRGGGDRP